ncbi:hypothetical protein [Streptomyces sp. JJ36]|uniref:hypothetical protein n=1 Tax=Streptomyces sp. JJ36 TaxID=2736645 RepID=UPI001F323037|nr:hypothetical protein [Streptomyces sp. JJ36]MCF6521942.1 hypothetical protein [Streptomyces sp. JJ36]
MRTDPEVAGPGGETGERPADPAFERVRAVADAILYEGYLLYPYRRSSPKNRVRWQFGILTPRSWAEKHGPAVPGLTGAAESWYQQTEVLLDPPGDPAGGAAVRVRLRWLQWQHKQVERRTGGGGHEPVASLEDAGTVHLTFDEAVPRATELEVPLAALPAGEHTVPAGAPGGAETEPLPGGAGRVVRRRYPVEARVTLSAEWPGGSSGPCRLRVRTENTGPFVPPETPRAEVLRYSLIATHTLLGAEGAEFVSLADPPGRLAPYARACRNAYTFPVLAGDAGSRDLMLSSPIILSDHPQVAPESPGDLHDAAEIDEILSLRTLLLTDEEKREARATDPRAAEILDRVDGMPPEVFARLHGAIRSLEPAGGPGPAFGDDGGAPPRGAVPWWREGGDDGISPETDTVLVDGVALGKGSPVRLEPRGRGADAQDMFLAGRTATVGAVFHDVDGSSRLAVTLDDDPAAELHSWYGRFLYFRPEEVRPLTAPPGEAAGPRPHPPEAPPGRTPVGGPAAAVHDRFRDRPQGRPRT